MKSLLSFILLASLGATALPEQDWFTLRTTFSPDPLTGFWKQPRTEEDAKSEGYIKISDCGGDRAFPGKRYIPNYDHPNIVLIYDDNGYIAGIQSIVTQDIVLNNGYQDISNNDMYQPSKINEEDVYLTTAYFVNPDYICSGGRPEDDFNTEGTGNTLIFQNGKDISPSHLMRIPRNQSDLNNHHFWRKHFCFINMGIHYSDLEYDPYQSCNILFPAQLLYHGGELHGFVWHHFGTLEGDLWEHPSNVTIKGIFKKPPHCMLEAIDMIGLSTMHIYFKNHLTPCE